MSLKDTKWKSWIRVFDIPDLYPETCPDAVTKITVWKRFNDIKCLQKEVKVLQKKLNIKDSIPSLPKSVIFKRFEDETINNRKKAILTFLEYIGKHSALFTSAIVVKFFETSHTPVELLSGNINTIRAKLNLPEETDFSVNSDDDKISDTDSFTSSNLGSVIQSLDQVPEAAPKFNTNLRKLNSMTSIDSHSSKTSEFSSILNAENSLLLLDGQYQNFNSSILDETIQYLVDASVHINLAIELESEKKYEEAFSAYKTAVEILINGGQSDSVYERKRMVKYKTEKYLIRAEKIYNMYLAPEVRDLMSSKKAEVDKPNIIKGPLFNLYKYKVIKIISPSGMLVLHSENQQIYYIKVIHKSVQFLNDHLILPEDVPYMMKLVNHYNSDYALFLVLEYCSGVKLMDYVKNESVSSEVTYNQHLLQNIQDQSDNESEISFSELLNEYAMTRDKGDVTTPDKVDSDSDSFVKVDHSDVSTKINLPNIFDEEIEKIDEPVMCSIKNADVEQSTVLTKRQLDKISNIDLDEGTEYNKVISELQIVRWGSQLLIALEKLHSIGVVCRDLCMDNLLIDENKNLILTYMCNVKELCDLYTKGINFDLAPEVYGFEEVTVAADWWSFGAILYELLVGLPLRKVHTNGISNYTHIKIPKYVSPEAKSLLRQLLIYEPRDRIGTGVNGIHHLKSHPFFRPVAWDSL
ncbi:hypothetical protein GWI33_006832 [Rhynchophorus ferrugineus]|uniref:Ribosomal protein S6 kinase delta-1 n=1 Tax=Rhynchophorus ferrugineus TaxID=354439 RepID=A0A834IKG1_RHYFE|nr:hypothetical protein GWI33_006832 [Rhynchophorus ferrugineus]